MTFTSGDQLGAMIFGLVVGCGATLFFYPRVQKALAWIRAKFSK